MKPGDKVVCVNDKNLYHIPVRGICEDLIYTLTEVFQCKCGNVYVRLAEVDRYFDIWCPKCNTFTYTKMFYHIERFRPLEFNENSEKEQDKQKEPVRQVHSL
jgi:phage FluMu protein Com